VEEGKARRRRESAIWGSGDNDIAAVAGLRGRCGRGKREREGQALRCARSPHFISSWGATLRVAFGDFLLLSFLLFLDFVLFLSLYHVLPPPFYPAHLFLPCTLSRCCRRDDPLCFSWLLSPLQNYNRSSTFRLLLQCCICFRPAFPVHFCCTNSAAVHQTQKNHAQNFGNLLYST